MHRKYNADGIPLIQALEDVNCNVRLVQAAWTHFSEWQEIGASCALTAEQLSIARCLLIEAIENWASAVSRLLGIVRLEEGLEHLTESLEMSLRRAAGYLSRVAAKSDPATPIYLRFTA